MMMMMMLLLVGKKTKKRAHQSNHTRTQLGLSKNPRRSTEGEDMKRIGEMTV